MGRKTDTLTPRQRQSQQIMREKSLRKKRRELMRKVTIVGGGLLSVIILGGGIWSWKSGAAVRTAQVLSDGVFAMTVDAGFEVDALYLEGRNRTSIEELEKAMGIKKGDPIFRISIGEVRERLEKIESVKYAAVERALPGSIYIRIVEREPVAMWQRGGKIALVDDNGVVMNGIDIAPYRKLPLVIGDSAPKNVKQLMEILASEPELSRQMTAAINVSDRRWNIRLSTHSGGSVEVRLPEDKPIAAWKRLAALQSEQQLLDRDVKVIDLRLEGKMFIKLSPDDTPTKTANARET